MTKGWIYFADAPETTLVKVGFATDLRARLASLRTGCPFDLQYIAYYRGTKEDERRLHQFLEPHRVQREWYDCADLIDEIVQELEDDRVSQWFANRPEDAPPPHYPTNEQRLPFPVSKAVKWMTENWEATE